MIKMRLLSSLKDSLLTYSGKVYNPSVSKRGNHMPIFVTQQWNNCQIRLTPSDYSRNLIRELLGRRDFIPYFYGPIAFDLAIGIPRKDGDNFRNVTIQYDWRFCTSKENAIVKKGNGSISLDSKKRFNYVKARAGDTTRYGFELALAWFRLVRFRKICAIDLGHVSSLDQYKIR
jgi:hypothetical protein